MAKKKNNKNAQPVQTESSISSQTVKIHRKNFAPIRGLGPSKLSQELDNFEAGRFEQSAYLLHIIEKRDPTMNAVASKRRKAVSRFPFEVELLEQTPAAELHKEHVEHFFTNLTTTDATDLNLCGGFRLLVQQMMTCVGMKYAVHEIVWKPDASTNLMTAEFRFVPLWFFRHTTGKLEFMKTSSEAVPMDPAQWMVAVGDGILAACAVAWMYKNMTLKEAVYYCQRNAAPGIHGKTPAAKGSDGWNAMVAAVRDMQNFLGVVTNTKGDEISPINLSGGGTGPFEQLIDRMDRAIIILQRGGDLSTQSADDSVGASVQGTETEILEEDDSEIIAETLNKQVIPHLIKYVTGDETPLVKIRLDSGTNTDTKQELMIDKALTAMGVPQPLADIYGRYNRSAPIGKEPALNTPADSVANEKNDLPANLGSNPPDPLIDSSVDELGQATAADFEPLRIRLVEIGALPVGSPEFFDAMEELQDELPEMLEQMNEAPASESVLLRAMTAGLLNAVLNAEAERPI